MIFKKMGARGNVIWHHHITIEQQVEFKKKFDNLFVASGQPRFDQRV
jgi:hypothetical protein